MKHYRSKLILFLFAFSSFSLQANSHLGHTWSPLPKSGFIKGRSATKGDVDKRNAIFAFVKDNAQSTPLTINIPQYALIHSQHTGKTIPVIIIQAEKVQGMDMVGYINLKSNKRAVTLLNKVKLLGTKLK